MYKFILLSFGSICSRPHVVIISFPLLSWRCVLTLHRGLYCTSCTPPCWSQIYARKMYNENTPSMSWWEALEYLLWILPPLLEPPPWSFHICLQAFERRQKEPSVHLRSWSQAIECIFRYHRLISHITPSFLQDFV